MLSKNLKGWMWLVKGCMRLEYKRLFLDARLNEWELEKYK